MNEIDSMERRAGITKRAKRFAPATAATTIAAVLGVTSPAAATPSAVKLPPSFTQGGDEWRAPNRPENVRLPATVVAKTYVNVLSEAGSFAAVVDQALPVNEEMDRVADRALRKRSAGRQSRKLTTK